MKDTAAFERIDLHLIRVLLTLITERSVSRAAVKLHTYQPAVSAALKRLRELTGDPILVRAGSGMTPTEAALQMAAHASRILQEADQLFLQAKDFAPEGDQRHFRIAASDYLDPLFLPQLMAQIKRASPASQLDILPLNEDSDYVVKLADGRLDLVIGNWLQPPQDLHLGSLFQDEIVCLVAQDNPLLRRTWDTPAYLGCEHVAPTPLRPGGRGVIDEHLQQLGLQRHITIRSANFAAIPHLVAQSLCILTTGRQFCERYVQQLPLTIVPCPIAFPPLSYYQLWHDSSHRGASGKWLREQVKMVASQLRRKVSP